MKRFGFLLVFMMLILAFNACQKDVDVKINDDLLINQETFTEQTLVDLDALVDEAIGLKLPLLKSAAMEGHYYVNTCPVITLNLTASPKLLTIDFGTGCKGKDGKMRSGRILVTSTSAENFTIQRIKTFDNFFVDGKKITGTVTRTLTIDRADHSKVAKVNENVTITFPDGGGTANRISDMTREYQLFVLGVPKDNVIISWGTSEFTRANGVKLTKTIAEAKPLVFRMECHQIVSGIVSVTTSDNRGWSIDYGNGECDNKASITKDGETKEITLRK